MAEEYRSDPEDLARSAEAIAEVAADIERQRCRIEQLGGSGDQYRAAYEDTVRSTFGTVLSEHALAVRQAADRLRAVALTYRSADDDAEVSLHRIRHEL